ncbi:hypothetical protein K0M31_018285 [Melipona bicolor]|uniref:Uncharacterized protein n=1 Tax=Melipona bicolor TaxID=60889 RepID=A0AA40FCP1_9HYME|nr:hypothetical protein K0M31_018285 [Melipona bicolor]
MVSSGELDVYDIVLRYLVKTGNNGTTKEQIRPVFSTQAQLVSGGMSFYYNIEERTDALTGVDVAEFCGALVIYCMRIEHFSCWQKNDYTTPC